MSEAVALGTRALEGTEGFTWIELPHYRENIKRWAFSCRLTVKVAEGGPVPATTDWWVLVPTSYPAGEVQVYPAKEGGLELTFPHQSHNSPGDPDRPWRTGNLCLERPVDMLDQRGLDTGPRHASTRLAWALDRACQWLRQAARGRLLRDGQPFELPDFRFGGNNRLATFETTDRLKLWRDTATRRGLVELWRLPTSNAIRIAGAFTDPHGEVVIPTQSWSPAFAERLADPTTGIWIRIDAIPHLDPWQAPSTFRELDHLLQQQGGDLNTWLPPPPHPPARTVQGLCAGTPAPSHLDDRVPHP